MCYKDRSNLKMHDRKIHRHSISLNEEDSSNNTVYCQKSHHQEKEQHKEGTGNVSAHCCISEGHSLQEMQAQLNPWGTQVSLRTVLQSDSAQTNPVWSPDPDSSICSSLRPWGNKDVPKSLF